MIDDIKKCVDARINFFDEYYTVPASVQSEIDAFFDEITALGNSCQNAAEFEEKFNTTGLSDKFNSLLSQCTPRSFKMTKEQKRQSINIMEDILVASKKELVKDAVMDVAETARVKVTGEALKQNREKMIEEGTFDDYTRTRNHIRHAEGLFGFLTNKFKSK